MIDLEELKRLALAATPGPWAAIYRTGWQNAKIVREGEHVNSGPICKVPEHSRSDGKPLETLLFIVAANPAVVLELIAEIERLQVDAKRYQLLRIADWDELGIAALYAGPDFDHLQGDELDAVVDAARATSSQPENGT